MMQFSDWVGAVCTIFEFAQTPIVGTGPSGDAFFNQIYPRAIDYTELRIQRDLKLLGVVVTDETGSFSANSRKAALSTTVGTYIVVSEIYPIIGGVRQPPLNPVSRAYIDCVWPSDIAATIPSVPAVWCMADQKNVLIGPPPDISYGMGVVGEQRVAPLGLQTASNLLSTLFPDLYVAASAIWLAGYQRDYGAQSGSPQTAVSWEQVYQELLTSADVEENRKKFMGPGDTTRPPSKTETPPQT